MNRTLGLIAAAAVSGAVCAQADAGLVAYYTLDNLDSPATAGSGLKNLGSALNSDLSVSSIGTDPTPTSVTGFIGAGALYFDGVDDGLWTSGSAASTSAPRTYSAWINAPSSSKGRAISVSVFTGYRNYEGIGAATSAKATMSRRNGNDTTYSITNTTAYADEWQHVLGVVHTGASSQYLMELYVNGKLVASTYAGTGPVTADLLAIGNVYRTNSGKQEAIDAFKGAIDDAGVFSTALTAADVALIYGLGWTARTGLDWLDEAQALNAAAFGTEAIINGVTWKRVSGLSGVTGDVGGSVAGGDAFIITDDLGNGIRVVPEPVSAGVMAMGLGLLAGRRRPRIQR